MITAASNHPGAQFDPPDVQRHRYKCSSPTYGLRHRLPRKRSTSRPRQRRWAHQGHELTNLPWHLVPDQPRLAATRARHDPVRLRRLARRRISPPPSRTTPAPCPRPPPRITRTSRTDRLRLAANLALDPRPRHHVRPRSAADSEDALRRRARQGHPRARRASPTRTPPAHDLAPLRQVRPPRPADPRRKKSAPLPARAVRRPGPTGRGGHSGAGEADDRCQGEADHVADAAADALDEHAAGPLDGVAPALSSGSPVARYHSSADSPMGVIVTNVVATSTAVGRRRVGRPPRCAPGASVRTARAASPPRRRRRPACRGSGRRDRRWCRRRSPRPSGRGDRHRLRRRRAGGRRHAASSPSKRRLVDVGGTTTSKDTAELIEQLTPARRARRQDDAASSAAEGHHVGVVGRREVVGVVEVAGGQGDADRPVGVAPADPLAAGHDARASGRARRSGRPARPASTPCRTGGGPRPRPGSRSGTTRRACGSRASPGSSPRWSTSEPA